MTEPVSEFQMALNDKVRAKIRSITKTRAIVTVSAADGTGVGQWTAGKKSGLWAKEDGSIEIIITEGE